MIKVSWLLEKCRSCLGWIYTWGAAETGNVDCSGLFVYWCRKKSLKLTHGTNTMWRKEVEDRRTINGDKSKLNPGDIVFRCKNWTDADRGNKWYGTEPGNVSHVGIYTGNGTVIEAKGTQYGVVESKWDKKWILAGRFKGTVNDLVTEPAKEQESGGETMAYTVVTESGNLNFRKGPSSKSVKIGSIPAGAVIEATAYNADWYKAKYNGVEGYVSAKYLVPFVEPVDTPVSIDQVVISLDREVFNALRLALNKAGGD